MALSNQTIQNLSSALAPEVVDFITSDDRWIDFMIPMIQESVMEHLKTEDYELVGELSSCIFDHLILTSDNYETGT